jgi:hypothetical protein
MPTTSTNAHSSSFVAARSIPDCGRSVALPLMRNSKVHQADDVELPDGNRADVPLGTTKQMRKGQKVFIVNPYTAPFIEQSLGSPALPRRYAGSDLGSVVDHQLCSQ